MAVIRLLKTLNNCKLCGISKEDILSECYVIVKSKHLSRKMK